MSNDKALWELNNELNIVYRYLRSKGVPHTDAEDAVQETAYKYLRFSDSIKSSQIRSWLTRVALNYYYDQYRKNRKYILDLEESIYSNVSSEHPELVLLANEQTEEFHRLLQRLKPFYVELLMLKYQSDLSYKEMSELLGVKVNTIKTNLFRARKKLIQLYGDEKNGR